MHVFGRFGVRLPHNSGAIAPQDGHHGDACAVRETLDLAGGDVAEQAAASGTSLAGRYRLERPVSSGPCTTLWRAVDDVLARPVAVKLLDSPGAVPRCIDAAEAVSRFTTAATSASRLAHSRIASTYDAGVEGDTPYVVTEWVDGTALAELVRTQGPLTPLHAQVVAMQAADALTYAHDNGIPHGQVDGFNVLRCGDGAIKLTDFGVASALAPDGDDAPASAPGSGLDGRDSRSLAALVYMCLTGRSVDGAEPALPAAPRRDGVLLSPGQVRAGVPHELDQIVMGALGTAGWEGRPIASLRDWVDALGDLPAPPPPADPIDEGEHPPAAGSPWMRVGVPALLGVVVVAIVIGAVVAGGGRLPAIGRDPGGSTSETASAATIGRLRIAAAQDFDPQGRPTTENSKDVPLAFDGKPETSWDTDRYRTAAFGALKPGVGLVFDLGEPVTVTDVGVRVAGGNTALELRASDARGAAADAYTLVASATGTGDMQLKPSSATRARYWLVWVTQLPAVSGGFRAVLSEVAFTGEMPR